MDNHFIELSDYLAHRRLQTGIVRLDVGIDDFSVSTLLDELAFAREHTRNVTLEILSPGGEVYAALALYDTLQYYGDITGLVRGYAASAAAMIVLQGCAPRLATPNSRFLIHEPQVTGFHHAEKMTSVDDNAKELHALQSVVLGILSARTGKSTNDLKLFMERHEHWLSAPEALDFGLIDTITERPV